MNYYCTGENHSYDKLLDKQASKRPNKKANNMTLSLALAMFFTTVSNISLLPGPWPRTWP
jgi:hypothetical protein